MRKTILVVDDEAAGREMLADMLELLGHHCAQAESVTTAIQLLGRRRRWPTS